MSDPLLNALDQLVPRADDEHGDWQAVLDASGVTHNASASTVARRRRVRFTRARVLAACVVVAVTVVSVTPAFGLRELIFDLVHGRISVSFVKSRHAPAEIKKQFLDLAIGAPRGMNPHVLPDQAKEITFLGAGGGKRVLWIAPTRGGGFCSTLVGAGGGCISKATEQSVGPVTIGGGISQRRGGPLKIVEVDGHVFSAKVATLTLEFQDHTSMALPFVYVSSPINAGFFIAGIPAAHQRKGHWPTEVVARDANGNVLATKTIRVPVRLIHPIPSGRFKPRPPAPFALASSVTPTSPVQTADNTGFTVVAGANGAIRLTATDAPGAVAKLLRGRVSIDCFRLTRQFGIFTVLSSGTEGAFADSIGFTLTDVGRPLDGCEIDTARGHRWPDILGSHNPVELAFTANGRAYFADRAAARDLALFVRSKRMQQIRREPGPQLLHDMNAAYGPVLTKSRIRYTLTPHGITFTETSEAGKTFRVVVENGRIKHSNVEPYAFVY